MEALHIYKELILGMHLLGVVIGLGGATIADLLFFKFLRDFRITKTEADALRTIAGVVIVALLALFITGLLLFWSDPQAYGMSVAFRFKMIIVSILTVNGILLHTYVSPNLVNISFVWMRKAGTVHHARMLRRLAFGMGGVSVISWYAVFLVSLGKRMLPESTTLLQLLAIYGLLLTCSLIGSQLTERFLRQRSGANV